MTKRAPPTSPVDDAAARPAAARGKAAAGEPLLCDCECPEPEVGVALISEECPVHNLHPFPAPPERS